MCELFGLSADIPERATKSLPVFANRYAQWNPDGWGLAFYQDSEVKIIRRPFPASSDTTFFDRVREAKSKVIIAHLRFATQGEPCMENCHPFHQRCFGRDWIFAHNGTISSCTHHYEYEWLFDQRCSPPNQRPSFVTKWQMPRSMTRRRIPSRIPPQIPTREPH
jgi:predicted glutamine amidotransferase